MGKTQASKAGQPADRRVPQARTQDVQVNIRMTSAERARLEDARSKLVMGVKVPLGPWMLSLALAEADRLLGPASTATEPSRQRKR